MINFLPLFQFRSMMIYDYLLCYNNIQVWELTNLMKITGYHIRWHLMICCQSLMTTQKVKLVSFLDNLNSLEVALISVFLINDL